MTDGRTPVNDTPPSRPVVGDKDVPLIGGNPNDFLFSTYKFRSGLDAAKSGNKLVDFTTR